MSTERNVQLVKDFFSAMGRGDREALLSLTDEDIEWVIPGEEWPLAGTHRGHGGLARLLQEASVSIETSYPAPPEYAAQGDRVMVVGFATGTIKSTKRTFEDHWVFAITVRDGRLTKIREYIDTQALARASQADRPSVGSAGIGRAIAVELAARGGSPIDATDNRDRRHIDWT